MNISDPRTGTCRWFLDTSEYRDWQNDNRFAIHNGLLWIKGKPGAGKSTLMSFALAQTRQIMGDNVIISFFFNARGSELEKSTSGLYRSLLVQLFDTCPDLQPVLDSIPENQQWNIESLERLFKMAILAMGACSPICFIDALDECDESEIRRMLEFFEDISEQALPSGTKLYTCFASRYYPNITVKKGLIVRFEDNKDHQHDISRYLDTSLNIGHSALAEEIRRELQRKASGIFMWVVLVVKILNREYDAGRPNRLRERLQEIPNDLHELFHAMLTRDGNNTNELLCCIQWILFSERSLSPRELYFAIISGIEGDRLFACHSEEVSTQDMERYILNISKGLAEIIGASEPGSPFRKGDSVQFIHEAVRDFLLKGRGLQKVWDEIGSNIEGQSHEKLKTCCMTYLKFRNWDIMPTSRSRLRWGFPFLEYASGYILNHAEKAESHGVYQSSFLSEFPLHIWLPLQKIIRPHPPHYTSTATLLYILAAENLPSLIKAQCSSQSCFTIEEQDYGAPIFAAISFRSDDAFQALFEVQAKRMHSDFDSRVLLQEVASRGVQTWPFIATSAFIRGGGLNAYIVRLGNILLYELFLSTEKDAGSPDLHWVVECGRTKLVRMAVENGSNVNIRDHQGNTPLHNASRTGHEAVFRLLLDHGAHVGIQDNYGNTPLYYAIAYGHEAVVRLLLDHGVHVDIQDNYGNTPLYYAIAYGREAVVRLLLNHGANIGIQDNYGNTPLHYATAYGHEAVVRLLLNHGAHVGIQDNYGNTPLCYATEYSHEAVVRLLLDHGAHIII
jgi:hypothetical protein